MFYTSGCCTEGQSRVRLYIRRLRSYFLACMWRETNVSKWNVVILDIDPDESPRWCAHIIWFSVPVYCHPFSTLTSSVYVRALLSLHVTGTACCVADVDSHYDQIQVSCHLADTTLTASVLGWDKQVTDEPPTRDVPRRAFSRSHSNYWPCVSAGSLSPVIRAIDDWLAGSGDRHAIDQLGVCLSGCRVCTETVEFKQTAECYRQTDWFPSLA